jgi:2,3-dihydroxybiphenyl 1,2-dioxygenase
MDLAIRKHPPNIFGKVHLGYVVIETRKFAEWARYGRDVVGLHVDEIDAKTMKFRLDDHACRFLLRHGPAEDVVALGWEIDDHASFDEVLTRVTERRVPIQEGTADEAALRGVERLWRIPGPKGIAQEIFTTPVTTDAPLKMINAGGYVTGESGMGHVAVFTHEPRSIRGYFNTVFDARLSDYIETALAPGAELLIRFLRVNQRHHSIAVAGGKTKKINPFRTKVQHLNVEAASLEDMVAAYERTIDAGVRIAMPVGQHSNDRELSFYSVTPSGFEWEIGWNPLLFTPEVEATWEPNNYQGISVWGHTPMGLTIVDKLNAFKTIVSRSFGYQEPMVPEFDAGVAPEGEERDFALASR